MHCQHHSRVLCGFNEKNMPSCRSDRPDDMRPPEGEATAPDFEKKLDKDPHEADIPDFEGLNVKNEVRGWTCVLAAALTGGPGPCRRKFERQGVHGAHLIKLASTVSNTTTSHVLLVKAARADVLATTHGEASTEKISSCPRVADGA